MKKNSIVQFVGFITQLGFEEFASKWDHYAKQIIGAGSDSSYLQQEMVVKSRYKYVSQHICPQDSLRFSFMKGRNSEYFAEEKVKVVQTGGYAPLQIGCKYFGDNSLSKVIAFASHDENDIAFYRELSLYSYLNIYQAYYESCTYGHVFEFFAPAKNVTELMTQLKTRPCTHASLYKECPVPVH